MKKNTWLIMGISLLAGCAQFTTNDQELAQLDRAARNKANTYVGCVTREAEKFLVNSADAGFIVDVARNNCTAALDDYKAAQSEFLDAQFMMIKDKLKESVELTDDRARNEIALMVITRQQQSQLSPAATIGAAVPRPAAAPITRAAGTPTSWTPDQRVYLDCMEDQARKYTSLKESAETIAEVAQSRCRDYMGGPNAALAQEGRTLVLGTIFDARVTPTR